MNSRFRMDLSALILGATSMVAQIIIIRELVVVFYGNELSLGVILASWLFWTAIGSIFFGRLASRLKHKEKFLSAIQILTSLALPLSIFFIRNIKSLLNIPTGKIIGFVPMLGSSFISLSVLCIMLGATFTLIAKIASSKNLSPSKEVGRIYLLEGLGAAIGGTLFSFFLIKTLSPFQNIFLAGGLNLAVSLLFSKNIFQIVPLILLSIAFLVNWPTKLEKYTRNMQFKPFEVIESVDSLYGNIAVIKTGDQFSFHENGLLLFTSGDRLTSEEAVHYAMLEHPSPKNILLIGGGISGSLKEILKHPVKKIDYVELDPLLIKLAEKYIPVPKDTRIKIITKDGRLFVKESGGYEKYDAIILDLPDPYTAMLNRFYSAEFFKELRKILAPDGIVSFSLTSSENYINPEQAHYLASIYNTLKEEFIDVKIFPGDTTTFFAANKKNLLTYDSETLINRLKERNIDTRFVREYYLPFKLNHLRIKYIEESIKEYSHAEINRDFKPIGYLYHTSLWMSVFHSGKGILPYIRIISLKLFIGIFAGLFLLVYFIQKVKHLPFRIPVTLSIGTTGMSEVSFQIIVILAFQVLYGYAYYKIGIILTSFMIGLVIGSFCINRILERIKDEKALYLKTQAFICIYPLILPLVFIYISRINFTNPALENLLETSFLFLPIIAGFLGGFQFPLANKICLKTSPEVGRTTGLLYGVDLFGSCLGGLLIGLLFIPILGIIESSILLFTLNFLVLILLFSSRD